VLSAAARFAVGALFPAPFYFPDEYLYSELARSIAATGLPKVRGAFVPFTPLLGPLLMSPAWLIRNTEIAYRASQAAAALAFSAAAFPGFALARRLGISLGGALAAVVVMLVIPDGIYSATLMSEPYAYLFFVTAVLVCVEALARPTRARQLAVVGVTLCLCLLRLQFIVLLPAYLAVALALERGSLRTTVRRQRLVVTAAGLAAFAVLAVGAATLVGRYRGIESFRYPPGAMATWFGIALLTVALAAGWVLLPGAALGFARLFRSATVRHRAFAWLSLILIVALGLEAAAFGVNEGRALERYTFYAVPLVAIACVWWIESGAPRRRAYRTVAYAGAAAMIVFPIAHQLRTAGVDQAPVLIGLGRAGFGGRPAALVWSPLLAAAGLVTAWIGSRRPRVLLVGAVAIGLATSAATSEWFVSGLRATGVPRGRVPVGAAVVTWSVESPFELMRVLFWHRDVNRVIVLDGGDSPDRFPWIAGRLVPGTGIVGADGKRIPGPFVALPDTLVGPTGHADRAPLRSFTGSPRVIAFGWLHDIGYVAPFARIYAAPGARPLRVTLRLWSPRHETTLRWRCDEGAVRTLEVGRRTMSLTIAAPARTRRSCYLSLIGPSSTVDGQSVSVRGSLRVARGTGS
jgi:hypothetical protein